MSFNKSKASRPASTSSRERSSGPISGTSNKGHVDSKFQQKNAQLKQLSNKADINNKNSKSDVVNKSDVKGPNRRERRLNLQLHASMAEGDNRKKRDNSSSNNKDISQSGGTSISADNDTETSPTNKNKKRLSGQKSARRDSTTEVDEGESNNTPSKNGTSSMNHNSHRKQQGKNHSSHTPQFPGSTYNNKNNNNNITELMDFVGKGHPFDRLQFGYSPSDASEACAFHKQFTSKDWKDNRSRNYPSVNNKSRSMAVGRRPNCEPFVSMIKLKRHWAAISDHNGGDSQSIFDGDFACDLLEQLASRQVLAVEEGVLKESQ